MQTRDEGESLHNCRDQAVLLCFIIWLQYYACSDWLLSGHYFLVMTGHYETFLGSFELRVKATSAWAKTTKKMVKRWYNYIFNN